jgi:hypothetical protein
MCSTERVPGFGSIVGECATMRGPAEAVRATADRGPPGKDRRDGGKLSFAMPASHAASVATR